MVYSNSKNGKKEEKSKKQVDEKTEVKIKEDDSKQTKEAFL